MKKILIFIGLKIAEIIGVCGIVGIFIGIGKIWIYLGSPFPKKESYYDAFMHGFLVMIGIALLGAFGYFIIWTLIKANWDWADRIARKK